MLKWLSRTFGDTNEKVVKRYRPIIEEINSLESAYEKMDDTELATLTGKFRERFAEGETLDDLLPDAFAAVREVAKRILGQRPYDVQLIGGIVIHHGNIAEMRTGEGKTLAATLPAYLNAIAGEGVHVITVNDYLAERDSDWMGAIYRALGMTVGVITNTTSKPDRRLAYAADITYGTNNEFGFDYLRDNMEESMVAKVQRGHFFAIVDEVDSILIDEARTPLIISGPGQGDTSAYNRFADYVKRLTTDDYLVDRKLRTVTLTDQGYDHVEKLGVKVADPHRPEEYDKESANAGHYLEQALKAQYLFEEGKDYVVKGGEIKIVDESTGRLMEGRRFSDGLHQALEAKHKVKVYPETRTYATITFQNYFRLYNKLSGMTGTALTEAEEFGKIYKLDAIAIPTNVPVVRRDENDLLYKTEDGKFGAVVEDIVRIHATGAPILVGTLSITKSEQLAARLKRRGLEAQILNAKYHAKEARIIARAGEFGAITIATNMAGRGVDISLGGEVSREIIKEVNRQIKRDGGDPFRATPADRSRALAKVDPEYAARKEKVLTAGGLHVIGTERHEARRIDNQLRGRAGRQGDPGYTRFYVCLEDEVMRRQGAEQIEKMAGRLDRLGMQSFDDQQPLEHKLFNRVIEQAQMRLEGWNFDTRKNLVEYDDVVNQQRKIVYGDRDKILDENVDIRPTLEEMISTEIAERIDRHWPEKGKEAIDYTALVQSVENIALPYLLDYNGVAQLAYQSRDGKTYPLGRQLSQNIDMPGARQRWVTLLPHITFSLLKDDLVDAKDINAIMTHALELAQRAVSADEVRAVERAKQLIDEAMQNNDSKNKDKATVKIAGVSLEGLAGLLATLSTFTRSLNATRLETAILSGLPAGQIRGLLSAAEETTSPTLRKVKSEGDPVARLIASVRLEAPDITNDKMLIAAWQAALNEARPDQIDRIWHLTVGEAWLDDLQGVDGLRFWKDLPKKLDEASQVRLWEQIINDLYPEELTVQMRDRLPDEVVDEDGTGQSRKNKINVPLLRRSLATAPAMLARDAFRKLWGDLLNDLPPKRFQTLLANMPAKLGLAIVAGLDLPATMNIWLQISETVPAIVQREYAQTGERFLGTLKKELAEFTERYNEWASTNPAEAARPETEEELIFFVLGLIHCRLRLHSLAGRRLAEMGRIKALATLQELAIEGLDLKATATGRFELDSYQRLNAIDKSTYDALARRWESQVEEGLPELVTFEDTPLKDIDPGLRDKLAGELGEILVDSIARTIWRRVLDREWIDYLTDIEGLRESIGLQAYAQRDPKTEYKIKAYAAFQELLSSIRSTVCNDLYRVFYLRREDSRPIGTIASRGRETKLTDEQTAQDNRALAGKTTANGKEGRESARPVVASTKVGRNDPCPCGSGKKYKACHGA